MRPKNQILRTLTSGILYLRVDGQLQYWQQLAPVTLIELAFRQHAPQYLLDGRVHPLCLAICLWMAARVEACPSAHKAP